MNLSISDNEAELLEIIAWGGPKRTFELIDEASQPKGSVFPSIARMLKKGWLKVTAKENTDPMTRGRFPEVSIYDLTDLGIRALRAWETFNGGRRPR